MGIISAALLFVVGLTALLILLDPTGELAECKRQEEELKRRKCANDLYVKSIADGFIQDLKSQKKGVRMTNTAANPEYAVWWIPQIPGADDGSDDIEDWAKSEGLALPEVTIERFE